MDSIWMGFAMGVLLMCVVVFIMLRVQFLVPLKRLTKMAEHMKELESRELQQQAESVSGVPGEVARAIAAYVGSSEAERDAETALNPIAEEIYKMHVVDEICRSLLPAKAARWFRLLFLWSPRGPSERSLSFPKKALPAKRLLVRIW